MNDFMSINLQINALTVYRAVLRDETIARFARVLNAAQSGSASDFCEHYGAFLQQLSNQTGSFDLARHIERLIRYDDNAFTRSAAQGGRSEGYLALRKAARFDLDALRAVADVSALELKKSVLARGSEAESELVSRLPDYSSDHELFSGDNEAMLSSLDISLAVSSWAMPFDICSRVLPGKLFLAFPPSRPGLRVGRMRGQAVLSEGFEFVTRGGGTRGVPPFWASSSKLRLSFMTFLCFRGLQPRVSRQAMASR